MNWVLLRVPWSTWLLLGRTHWIKGTKYPKDEGEMSDILKLLDALGQSDVDWTQLLSNSIASIARIEVEAAQGKEAVTISR